MITTIQPSFVKGTLKAPASKSSMQRACAAALLSKGASIVESPGTSNDDRAAMDVITKLGAIIRPLENGDLEITSRGVQPLANEINCGESGLGIRMFTPLAALCEKELTINGSGSLVTRPMNFFDEIFPQLGIQLSSNSGKLPLHIKGPLTPADITIDGSLSSQFLTGLLMAFAASGASGVSIKVNDLKSRPYIDLTLDVMKKFGVEVENRNYEEFYFPGTTSFMPARYTVEGDWSGASFLLVAGAISGDLVITGLDPLSTQADKAILQALAAAGAFMSVKGESIKISKSQLKAFHFDATDCPDLFPPLVALAAYCDGTTAIEGVKRLTHKESDRSLTLQEEFGKMGIHIDLQDDLMLVHGSAGIYGATVHSHHDHRIAMACAVAALGAEGETIIEVSEAINKSYPSFYQHLQQAGAGVQTFDQPIKN